MVRRGPRGRPLLCASRAVLDVFGLNVVGAKPEMAARDDATSKALSVDDGAMIVCFVLGFIVVNPFL